jgi:hypothetical protein
MQMRQAILFCYLQIFISKRRVWKRALQMLPLRAFPGCMGNFPLFKDETSCRQFEISLV